MEAIRKIINSMQELRELGTVPIPQPRDKELDPNLSQRALKKTKYHLDHRGNVVRNQPKRPEGISSRQWKRQEKARRRGERNEAAVVSE